MSDQSTQIPVLENDSLYWTNGDYDCAAVWPMSIVE